MKRGNVKPDTNDDFANNIKTKLKLNLMLVIIKIHLFYKQCIFDPLPKNFLSLSKKSP